MDNCHNMQTAFFVFLGTDFNLIFDSLLVLCSCECFSLGIKAKKRENGIESCNTSSYIGVYRKLYLDLCLRLVTTSCQPWLFGFSGISTFVDYLMPNSFLYKKRVLFQTIQFSINTEFNSQKHFCFKQFSSVKQF